jgi:chromosome partitioning protein
MSKIISFVNLKGGVGKTAISVNFAAYCARKKLRTLLIDLDPQTNATFSCIDVEAWQKHAAEFGTVANILGARSHASPDDAPVDVKKVIKNNVLGGVDLIPSHLDLFTIDLDLAGTAARETRLRRAIKPIKDDYDVIVCDCPPNLTIPTQNAIAASTHFAVPISPDYLSLLGVGILLNRIKRLQDELENPLTLAGIIISRVGRRAVHREATIATLREQFGEDVWEGQLAERVAVDRGAASQRSVFESGDAEAIAEFGAMSLALLNRMEVKL